MVFVFRSHENISVRCVKISSQGREDARKREDGFFHRKAARPQGNARMVFFIARPRGCKETRGWFFSSQGREAARKREDGFFHRKAARMQGNARMFFFIARPRGRKETQGKDFTPCVPLHLCGLALKKIPAFLCVPLHLCGLALKKKSLRFFAAPCIFAALR